MNMQLFNQAVLNTVPRFQSLVQVLAITVVGAGLLLLGTGCDSGGSGGTAAPPAPAQLELVSGDQQVEMNWSSVDAGDLAGYAVRRSSDASSTVSTLTPVDSVFEDTSHTDASVKNGTVYTYWVVAVDKAGNKSDPSPKKKVRPFDGPPENP